MGQSPRRSLKENVNGRSSPCPWSLTQAPGPSSRAVIELSLPPSFSWSSPGSHSRSRNRPYWPYVGRYLLTSWQSDFFLSSTRPSSAVHTRVRFLSSQRLYPRLMSPIYLFYSIRSFVMSSCQLSRSETFIVSLSCKVFNLLSLISLSLNLAFVSPTSPHI